MVRSKTSRYMASSAGFKTFLSELHAKITIAIKKIINILTYYFFEDEQFLKGCVYGHYFCN
jgi:undecaprenyl pyrophosphate synthase